MADSEQQQPYLLAPETPALLPLASMAELFDWYLVNLCDKNLIDPRGYRVHFQDTDFVHLIKMVNKFGEEPRNQRMTIEQICSGRILLRRDRFDVRRAQELSWARSIIETPDMIVPNWQIMGRANPGDAYIKNFGAGERKVYRVLICGHAGKRRRAVTIFPRERFAYREIATILWP